MCPILSLPWATIGKVLSGAVTLLIALIATGIAYQQFVVNRRQYRLALFEKRMVVYNATMDFIALVLQTTRPTNDDCMSLMRATRDSEFLFGAEIEAFIDQVWKNGLKVDMYNQTGAADAQKRANVLNWFSNKIGEGTKLFLKYLDFREPD
jgi:hypothetical protein